MDVHDSGPERRWPRLVENDKHVRGLSRHCKWIRVYRTVRRQEKAGMIILMLIKYIKRLDGAADHDANIIILSITGVVT